MEVRIFSRFLIYLFFILFSAFSNAQWKLLDRVQGNTSAQQGSCQSTFFLKYPQYSSPDAHIIFLECRLVTFNDPSQNLYFHKVEIYKFIGDSCSGDSYPPYPLLTCPPPQCNSDQILNPETNTCDARCTAPDVWDPVTQQCITAKNRCDILGERKPVVEVDWRQSTLGSSVVGKHSCMPSSCVVVGTNDVGCLSDSDRCYGDAKYTGTECTYTEGVTSGWCSDETCSDQTPVEPVPDPDNPNPEPPSPNPDPTPGDGFTPPNPDTSADPNNPNLQEEGNKGVVNELNTANKTLENIEKTLKTTLDEITTQNKDVDKANDKLILGIQNLAKAVSGAGSSGGGGGGGGDTDHGYDDSVSAASCDAFECKGNAVVCYIAKKQWEEACGVEKAKRDDIPKITDGIDKIINDHPLDDLNAGTLNVDSVMNKYTQGGGLNVSKACPAPDSVNAGIASFTLDYTPFCDLAKIIHFFIVAFALVGSALLIAKYGL